MVIDLGRCLARWIFDEIGGDVVRLGKGFTVKQDGKGNAQIVKKPWGSRDASAQIRMKKSKRIRVQRPQLKFGK